MIKIFSQMALFLTLLCCASCAGNLRVSLKECEISQAQFADITGNSNGEFKPDRTFTTKLWSTGIGPDSVTDVVLKDVLSEQGVSCVSVKYLRYTIGQSFWDQIFSVIPFVQRSSLKVEVVKTDDAVGF